jgi:hypothetical protein
LVPQQTARHSGSSHTIHWKNWNLSVNGSGWSCLIAEVSLYYLLEKVGSYYLMDEVCLNYLEDKAGFYYPLEETDFC